MKAYYFPALLILLATLALAGCEKDSPPASLPALTDSSVILAFGDSITHGTGADRGLSYPSQLAERTGLKVVNAGVPGETTAGGLKRLPGVVAKSHPDLVILCLGGNDFLKRVDTNATRENLRSMLDWLKSKNIPVILMAVPRLGMSLTGQLSSAELYAELGEEYGVVVENGIISKVLSQRSLKADQIHPNAKGYERIASALESLLEERGVLAP